MLDILTNICQIITAIVAGKAITLGSDFSFYNFYKYKMEYWDWYFNRPKFKP